MAQLIGYLIAGYLCIYLPWKANQKEESRKRQDMRSVGRQYLEMG